MTTKLVLPETRTLAAGVTKLSKVTEPAGANIAAALYCKWRLTPCGPPTWGSCSVVIPVRDEDGRPLELKLTAPSDTETAEEHLALRRWGDNQRRKPYHVVESPEANVSGESCAETRGFEPRDAVTRHFISSEAHSAALARLQALQRNARCKISTFCGV